MQLWDGGGQLVLLGYEGPRAPKEAAYALLRLGVRRYCGLKELPEIARESLGKPYFPAFPDLHFSLSHTPGFALCALGVGAVGVDIEALRPRAQTLAAQAFSPSERAWYDAHGGDWGAFYTLWTRKESWVKYFGKSIFPPRRAGAPLPEEIPQTELPQGFPGAAGAGKETKMAPVVRSYAGPDWRAAVCAQLPLPDEILWISPEILEKNG